MVQSPEKIISDAGIPAYLHGFSAIDSYLDRNSANSARVLCGADLADLARLFEGLRYPGTAVADAAVDSGGKTWYFRCEDGGDVWNYRSLSFAFLEFYRDCKTGRYYDPRGVYPFLRGLREGKAAETGAARWW
ncbi:MAG: hypothetical protein FWH38_10575, partial [Treponema sp.]|nr:hypothetical protein [Treponema sp.]